MLTFFKNLFAPKTKINLNELRAMGVIILDVRTEVEYASGHVKGSINIPINRLEKNVSKLKKDKPIITCCASGIRSSSAKTILQRHGFTQVINGGSWHNLQ